MKHLTSLLTLSVLLLAHNVAKGDSFIITSPEHNVRTATLIIEAVVIDIHYEEISGVPFAVVRLKVEDRIVGESPDEIVIRRAFVTTDLRFLKSSWLPSYSIGERFITTLLEYDGSYTTLGLYNGKFSIVEGAILDTEIPLTTFKQMILDVRSGAEVGFPNSMPRQGNSLSDTEQVYKTPEHEMETQSIPCYDGTPYLDDQFRVWDFTWNTSYVPAQIHYNDTNKHINAPSVGDMEDLFELAHAIWDDDFSFFSFENASSFTTSEGLVDNNTSVVLWVNYFSANVLGEARPYPNTQNKITNCNTDGSGSNTSVDILMNNNSGVSWHFGSTPPGSHTTGSIDFVEVLAHELGHGLGLAHNPQTSSIMHNYYNNRTGSVRGLNDGNKAARVYQHAINPLSGTLPARPIVLSADNLTISGTLTIPSSGYLEVVSTSLLSLSQGSSILSYGVLNLNGATIQKSGSNNWDALTLSGSGVAGSTITGSTITGSVNGVRLINASGVIITSSQIQSHQNNGLYVYGSGGIQITSTDFSMNGAAGILSDVSAVYFHPLNSFSNNSGSGIVADGASSMTFGAVNEEANVTAMANAANGVHALAYSYVELGGPAGGSTYGGWNTIRSNTSYNAQAQNNSYIESQYTYWGPGTISDKINADGSSSVDYSNWLSHPAFKVVPGSEVQKTGSGQISSGQHVPVIWKLRQELARDEFDEAWWLAHPNEEMRQAARIVLMGDALQTANYTKTVNLAESVLENSRSAYEQELAYRTLFLVDLMEGDYRSAVSYLDHIPEQGAGNHRQHLAALLPADIGLFERDQLEAEHHNTVVSITNYPNPFNPTTLIGYQLPVSSVVKLSVYDLLGREVSVLVSGEMPAGMYQTSFDGRNLASGIYLYRLQVNGQVVTGKMLLTK